MDGSGVLPMDIVYADIVARCVLLKITSAITSVIVKIYFFGVFENLVNIYSVLWTAGQPHNNHFVIERNT